MKKKVHYKGLIKLLLHTIIYEDKQINRLIELLAKQEPENIETDIVNKGFEWECACFVVFLCVYSIREAAWRVRVGYENAMKLINSFFVQFYVSFSLTDDESKVMRVDLSKRFDSYNEAMEKDREKMHGKKEGASPLNELVNTFLRTLMSLPQDTVPLVGVIERVNLVSYVTGFFVGYVDAIEGMLRGAKIEFRD